LSPECSSGASKIPLQHVWKDERFIPDTRWLIGLMEYKMCVGNDGPYFCVFSQFEDIYQQDMFMDHLVKELPEHLCSLDLEAIGSLVSVESTRGF
jgi:hypothetical protein